MIRFLVGLGGFWMGEEVMWDSHSFLTICFGLLIALPSVAFATICLIGFLQNHKVLPRLTP